VIRCLVEGSSINPTTVLKLLVEFRSACSAFLRCDHLIVGDVWVRVLRGCSASATARQRNTSFRIHRVQLTTDGLKVYLIAVLDVVGEEIDYAMLHKIYGAEPRRLP